MEIQEYFIDGNCNKKVAKLIFKARYQTLDIKTQRKWIYADLACIGCRKLEESGEEILICEVLNEENRTSELPVKYDYFYSNNVHDIVKAGKMMQVGLRRRQEILEVGIT